MQLEFLKSYPAVMTAFLTPRFFDVTTSDDFHKSSTRVYGRVKNWPPSTLAWFARQWYGNISQYALNPLVQRGPQTLALNV